MHTIQQVLKGGRGEVLALGLLLALYLLGAAAYGSVTPALEAPDAGGHLRYIAYLRTHGGLPPIDAATAAVSHELVQQPPLYYAFVAMLLPSADVEPSLAYEAAAQAPYYAKGLGKRVTVSLPEADPAAVWPLRAARAVSLAGGLLMVGAVYVLARTLLRSAALGLAAAAVVAFNPQFLFTSSTISNDMWAAALATTAVAAAVLAARGEEPGAPGASLAPWFGVGVLCGLATLAKYSGVITLLPVALCALLPAGHPLPSRTWRERAVRLGKQGLLVGGGFLVVTSVQFAHNWAWTGEILPLGTIRTLLTGMVRPQPLGAEELWGRVQFLSRSATGIFGYGVRATPPYFEIVDLLLWLAAGGTVLLLLRTLLWGRQETRPETGPETWQETWPGAWVIAAAWFAAALGSLASWIRVMIAGEQGRLLFPAAGAFAVLLVLGWIGWLPRRLHGWGAALVVLGMAGLGVWQWGAVAGAYAPPPALAEPLSVQRPVGAVFAGSMQLVGYDLPAGAATDFSRPLPLTLYWRSVAPPPGDYTLFVHLALGDDRMIYQFDGTPYSNRHPPRQWRVGEVFADRYALMPPASDPGEAEVSGPALLSVGFYPTLDPSTRALVYDGDGQLLGDRLLLGPIRILPASEPVSEPAAAGGAPAGAEAGPRVVAGVAAGTTGGTTGDMESGGASGEGVGRWEDGIVLEDVAVVQEEGGVPVTLQLTWRADALGRRDWTFFVQALDGAGKLAAQVDRQPQGGAAPTSTWLVGERFVERVTLGGESPTWRRIIVGWYDAGGRRLATVGEGEADYVVLWQANGEAGANGQ